MLVFVLLLFVSLPILLTVSQDGTSKRCVLPSYPAHGGYVVSGNPNAVPGQTFETVRLNVTCRPGFRVAGKNVLLCIDGFWSQKLPECVRSCRLDKHPSVKYRCVISTNTSEERYRDCDLNELVGTVVKPECNAPNYYRSGVLSYMRCTNSGWDFVSLCTPECGRITAEGKEQISGGMSAKHGELPWHSGIYTKTATPYKQMCGGSLVSTKVVISAAHCFWDNHGHKLKQASQFAVAVGKMYRPWGDPHDVDAQRSDVNEIKVPKRFQGPLSHYQNDLAVVVLTTTIVYKTYVRPVCMDFNHIFENRQLRRGKIGKVAGWGLTAANGPPSPVLKVLETPYIDVIQCIDEAPPQFIEFITSDKICAGEKDGKAICEGDSGGGLVFSAVDRDVERYYLRGVASAAPKSDDACNVFAVTSYTQITAHTSFIEDFCVLPPYPEHGRYVVKGEPNAKPRQSFATVELDVHCNPGYAAEDNVTLVCSEGWWSDNMPRCARLCKLDKHISIRYHCLTNDKNDTRECNDEERHGTTIKPECKAPYFSRFELPHMRCVEGNWDNYPTCRPGVKLTTIGLPPVTCKTFRAWTYGEPDRVDRLDITANRPNERNRANHTKTTINIACGKISPEAAGRFPWHATIYTASTSNKSVEYKGGGTLVSSTIVVSDANCFVETVSDLVKLHLIAVGNQYHKWQDPRDHHMQYNAATPFGTQLENDNGIFSFTIFQTSTPFKLTPHVSPVCLDFDVTFEREQLQQGAGKVSSWDKGAGTEMVYKTLSLPFLDVGVCSQPESHWPKPNGMFCSKAVVDGSSRPCSVDCGAGFSVPDAESDGERYYLRGIVTLLPKDNTFCTTNQPLGITHIKTQDRFVQQLIIVVINNKRLF